MSLFSRNKAKIKVQTTKKDGFSGWLKCSHCQELIHNKELEHNYNCCPKCDYHSRFPLSLRIKLLADTNSFSELFAGVDPVDPLNFADSIPYTERLERAQNKSGNREAVVTGECAIDGYRVALGVMDFSFMGGSMGSVVGEKITRLIEHALYNAIPLIMVCSSGGARMQESILSLMQMAKISAALASLHEKHIPYISILTNPTAGGVTASFASLGDVIIAEPKALICFAGPRIIEQTIGQQLPPGAQRSEFLLSHGMIDCIISRPEMKAKVAQLLSFVCSGENDARADRSVEEALWKKLEMVSIER